MTGIQESLKSENFRLRSYQTEAVKFLITHRRSILALAPGTGKTPVALSALRDVGAQRTLVVCPKSVIRHWIDLAATWHPGLWVWNGTGTVKVRTTAREDAALIRSAPSALVINYESMRQDIEGLMAIS